MEATETDVAQMVALAEAKRTEYAAYSPIFWRKAEGSAEEQARFFANWQLRDDKVITLTIALQWYIRPI